MRYPGSIFETLTDSIITSPTHPQGSVAESEEKTAALLFSRITPARMDEHVPIHYVRFQSFCIPFHQYVRLQKVNIKYIKYIKYINNIKYLVVVKLALQDYCAGRQGCGENLHSSGDLKVLRIAKKYLLFLTQQCEHICETYFSEACKQLLYWGAYTDVNQRRILSQVLLVLLYTLSFDSVFTRPILPDGPSL